MTTNSVSSPLPLRAGIGLRSAHYETMREAMPDVGFLEIHPENYFGGGVFVDLLEDYSRLYPLSFHCVGLSLGTAGELDKKHIRALKTLMNRINPAVVSDHVSWSATGNAHLGDLLPLPYTPETLAIISDHISEVQDALGRKMLVENPSAYLAYEHSSIGEPEFLASLCERTGCGLLLDVNNIYVQCNNNGGNPQEYFSTLAPELIGEIHLAGHHEWYYGDVRMLIDTHDRLVRDEVWALYADAIRAFGRKPTLIEWDSDLPEVAVLAEEAKRADAWMETIAPQEKSHAVG